MRPTRTDTSKGNFDEALLAQARELASSMSVKLLVKVDRVRGAIEYRDNSGQSPTGTEREQANVARNLESPMTRVSGISKPLKDTHDGLCGFELKDADGYVLFFGRPRS